MHGRPRNPGDCGSMVVRVADSSDGVLFCPYCREAFERVNECPEHELTLVPWTALPGQSHEPAQDASLGFFDPRFGRGILFAASLLILVGFFLPFVGWANERASALEAALDAAINLWFVPGVVMVQFWVLAVRRTAQAVRRAWPALALVPVIGMLSLAYSLWHITRSAGAMGHDVTLLWGGWLMLIGLFLAMFGGLRMGFHGTPRRLY